MQCQHIALDKSLYWFPETTAVLSLQDPFGSWGPDTREESGASSENTASQLLLATHGIFLQGPQISLSSLNPELFLFPPQFPSEAFSFIIILFSSMGFALREEKKESWEINYLFRFFFATNLLQGK